MIRKIAMSLALFSPLAWSAELPNNLIWVNNNEEPLFASTEAKFGGTFRTYISSFPQTFRIVGPDSNGAFRGWLLDSRPASVSRHPITKAWIPDIATHWAYGADNRTVYFKIHPKAKWSDGQPITSADYRFVLTLMRSSDIVAPWYNQFYQEQIEDVVVFDDRTFAVVSAKPRDPDELMMYANLQPRPAHFYAPSVDKNKDGIDDDFVYRYNFKPEPSAGPYAVEKVKKGKYITFKHVGENWWGYDNRYYQHRFNVEKIRVKVIRDDDIAQKYFEKGQIDSFSLARPRLWHDKSNTEPYQKGYIHRFWGYNQTPQGAGGVWINTAKPFLGNLDVRKGLAHAIDFDGLIEKVLRNDFVRKPNGLGVGHGDYTNPTILPPQFDPSLAASHFEKGGFREVGSDGIRVNENGERLSFAMTYSSPLHTPPIWLAL